MARTTASAISELLSSHETGILTEWLALLSQADTSGRIGRGELEAQTRDFLRALREAAASDDAFNSMESAPFVRLRDVLGAISRSRAQQGFSPSETAIFVFSLKQPLFARLREMHGKDGDAVG